MKTRILALAIRCWRGATLLTVNVLLPALAYAQESVPVRNETIRTVGRTGPSVIWLLANFSYAGMVAQASESTGWRIVAFILGFPGTLITLLAVKEGSERAYGVDLPKKKMM